MGTSMADIAFSHHAPAIMVWAGLLVAVAWALNSFRVHGPTGWLGVSLMGPRLAFLALLGWCLLQPTTKLTVTEETKPHFAVLIDRSASMIIAPQQDTRTRWDVALDLFGGSWIDGLEAQCHVRLHPFTDALEERATVAAIRKRQPDGKRTHIREVLKQLRARYDGLDMAGILLLTDGLDTRELTMDWTAALADVPIHAVQLEPEGLWHDRPNIQVHGIDTPRRVIVGAKTKLRATVSGHGMKQGAAQLQARLLRDGALLQESTLDMPKGATKRDVTFEVEHPEPGSFTYTVEVQPVPGEQNTSDNTYAVVVEVAATGHRVLYVEAVLRWEPKYLTRALLADSGIEPSILLQTKPGRWQPSGNCEGIDAENVFRKLASFRVVILGDTPEGFLSEDRADALVGYVEDGGALALIGGRYAWEKTGYAETALKRLLPVKGSTTVLAHGSFAVHVPNEGRSHPVFQGQHDGWRELPDILSLFQRGGMKDGAVCLLGATVANVVRPVVAVQRFGEGKVACVMTDTLWKWQLSKTTKNYYRRFWQRLVEWLAADDDKPSTGLDLTAACTEVHTGETLRLVATLLGTGTQTVKNVTCEVTRQDQKGLSFPMAASTSGTAGHADGQHYTLAFEALTPGLHVVVAKAETSEQQLRSAPFSFFVRASTPETTPRPANTDLLEALTKTTGGTLCQPNDVDRVMSGLEFKTKKRERVQHRDLWQVYPVSLILAVLLTLEWTIRKAKNMV